MIPLILSTGSLYTYDLDTIFSLAREVGFDGVEVMLDQRRETHHVEHLRQVMARHDCPILAVHSPFARANIHGWPTDPIARIKKSVALAETLGARTVVVHPPLRWMRLRGLVIGAERTRKVTLSLPLLGMGRLGRWLWHELPAYQAETAVTVALENMPCRWLGPFLLEPHHFSRPAHLRHFDNITLDTTHVGTHSPDLLGFYRRLADKVAHVHLSNYNGRQHRLLNDGHLPLQPFLSALVRDGYQGLVSVELSPASLNAADEDAVHRTLRETVTFCRAVL